MCHRVTVKARQNLRTQQQRSSVTKALKTSWIGSAREGVSSATCRTLMDITHVLRVDVYSELLDEGTDAATAGCSAPAGPLLRRERSTPESRCRGSA